MDRFKAICAWIYNADIIPPGYLTQAAGWLGILMSGACMLHIQVAGYTCPGDPVTDFITGLVGLGLGRRKSA